MYLVVFAIAKLLVHTYINRNYGFHRDELATLDDARRLAWGYVAYPPLTPFLGRVELTLFGTSLAGFRFLAAAAQSVVILLSASIARHLGGDRRAQWLAALAVAISPVSLTASSLFQYVSFDFLWWVLLAWLVVRLVVSDDPRWWVAIGAVIGLGVLTKYTIVFFVTGIVIGVLASPLRNHLRSKWLWIGVAVSLLVAAPNLIWQIRHDFISLDFLRHIHERDVRIGRTDDFLLKQLFVPANLFAAPLWIAGLGALFAWPALRRFRILGIMALVPFALFVLARGRDYYTAPIYPMLIAAGAVWLMTQPRPRLVFIAYLILIVFAGAITAVVATPVTPLGSPWWKFASDNNGDLKEEVGWPELVGAVARVWSALPADERARTAILCANYGEAGAVNLYGPAHGLPEAISGINSFGVRGYGNPPPETVISVGRSRESLERGFESVTLTGRIPNPLGVENEEAERPEIYLCRRPRLPWPVLWERIRSFG